MNAVVVVLPLPSIGCAQNRHSNRFERQEHTKHDRNVASRTVKTLGVSADWSPEGTFSLSIEVNTVTWVDRYRAQGFKRKDAQARSRMMRSKKFSNYMPDDVQNAIGATKAFCDGLVDAGLIKDDSKRYLVEVTGRIVTDSSRDPGVVLTLTRTGGPA